MAYTTIKGKLVRVKNGQIGSKTISETIRDNVEEEKKKKMKGGRGLNCNRTACQKPPATYYNSSTRAWYCESCANMIDEWSIRQGEALLCAYDPKILHPFFNFSDPQPKSLRQATMAILKKCQEDAGLNNAEPPPH